MTLFAFLAVCNASHLPLSYSTVSFHPIHIIKEHKAHEEWKAPVEEWKAHEEWKAPAEEWKAPVVEWKEPEKPANYEFSKYTQFISQPHHQFLNL